MRCHARVMASKNSLFEGEFSWPKFSEMILQFWGKMFSIWFSDRKQYLWTWLLFGTLNKIYEIWSKKCFNLSRKTFSTVRRGLKGCYPQSIFRLGQLNAPLFFPSLFPFHKPFEFWISNWVVHKNEAFVNFRHLFGGGLGLKKAQIPLQWEQGRLRLDWCVFCTCPF